MNKELPIYRFKDEIVKTIRSNAVTIIVADTGSGKSTQVPQMLLENTNYNIVVTQPRRIAAKSISSRVAEEMQTIWGELVAFRTAHERNDSDITRCLFCTDGLQLVRELTQAKLSAMKGAVLVIDEVHEWNLNLEGMVAWAKYMLLNTQMRVVLMSATVDAEKLSLYFGNAPIIKVPGKKFPVIGSPTHKWGVSQCPSKDLILKIEEQVELKKNCLVFLPGKLDISQTKDKLTELGLMAEVFELHGDLNPKDQDLVFQPSYLPKVVLATNIAQTSITIPDIDSVIDLGIEKRIELQDGVEALVPSIISKDDVIQRAGRAGRVKEGLYTLCNDLSFEKFPIYSTPDILRIRFDQLILRFIHANIDPLKIDFYHQPCEEAMQDAIKHLQFFGALDDKGEITQLGKQICHMPVGVETSVMIVEAIKHECLEPIITIAAILESHYSTLRRAPQETDDAEFKSWRDLIGKGEYKSDLLVDLELYAKANELGFENLERYGISQKAYLQVNETRIRLLGAIKSMGLRTVEYFNTHADDAEAISKCVFVGMARHLYKNIGGAYTNSQSIARTLSKESILHVGTLPDYLVGIPKNYVRNHLRNSKVTYGIANCTAVNKEWVAELNSFAIQELAIGAS